MDHSGGSSPARNEDGLGALVRKGSMTKHLQLRHYLKLETLFRKQDFLARNGAHPRLMAREEWDPSQDVLCQWSQQEIRQVGCGREAEQGHRSPQGPWPGCDTWNETQATEDRKNPGRLLLKCSVTQLH